MYISIVLYGIYVIVEYYNVYILEFLLNFNSQRINLSSVTRILKRYFLDQIEFSRLVRKRTNNFISKTIRDKRIKIMWRGF